MFHVTEPAEHTTRSCAAAISRLFCGATASAFLCATASAQAQSTVAESKDTIAEIVVTAQKRSERLLDVPAPVTALSADDLSRISAVKLEDIAAKVPGLSLSSNRPGETQIILRGINTGSTVSSTTATYIDDTAFGSSTNQALAGVLSPDLDPSDVQRVEVLRGPQGTLYGASSLGGLIKYVTAAPALDAVEGRIGVDGSTVSSGGVGHGIRGMINLPLVSDSLAFRASAYQRRDAGFIDNVQLGQEDVNEADVAGGRAALLWQANDKLSISLTATLQNLDSDGSQQQDVTLTADDPVATRGDLQQVRFTAQPETIHYRLYSASVDYDMEWAELISITSYSTLHQKAVTDQTAQFGSLLSGLLGIPGVGFSVGSDLDLEKATQEVRLQSPTGRPLEWRLGAYYTHEKTQREQPSTTFLQATQAPIVLPAPIFFAQLGAKYDEYAGYADLKYHVTPRWNLSAGVRYSTNDQQSDQTSGGLGAGGTTSLSQQSSDDSTTFQVSTQFNIDSNQMIYARVATGYRPGGPNAVTPVQAAAGVPTSYDPDTLTNYDVGYKAAIFDRTVTLDLSAFYINWQDVQILTNFNGITSAGNGGSAKSQGVEAGATWVPLKGLSLSATAAYTDAQLTEAALGVNGKDGDRLPNVPKWAGSLSLDYDFGLSQSVAAFIGGGVHYVGDRSSGFVTGSPATFTRPEMPEYTTVDLRTGVYIDRYTVQLYAKNIGDKRGLSNILSNNGNSYLAPFTASVIQPRTVGLSVVASF
jgi:outer membrane receptor protein involved in Fe transport